MPLRAAVSDLVDAMADSFARRASRFSGCGGARRGGEVDRRGVDVAAAQRAREIDVELERARPQIGVEAILDELLRLRREHGQVVAEPRLVADDGEVVGVGRRLAGARLLGR